MTRPANVEVIPRDYVSDTQKHNNNKKIVSAARAERSDCLVGERRSIVLVFTRCQSDQLGERSLECWLHRADLSHR